MGGLIRRRAAAVAAGVLFLSAVITGMAAVGPARAADAPVPLKLVKQGYYTNKITGALPPVLVKEVPPGPVCLVVPQICNPEVDALKTALSLNDGVPLPDIPDFLVPQPIPPGELPIGMIGGANRYSSALQFDIPKVDANSVVNRFALVIDDGSVAFSIQSPAFREAILTGLSQYPEQQPEVVDTFVADVTSQQTALADFTPTGIEACMITSAWDAGESQDPTTKPKTDCIVGGEGKHDDATGTWTFDISGVVQAWVDGTPNLGITLSPAGAQNVAYGDPDPSTNFIITLASTGGSGLRGVLDIGPPEPALDTSSPSDTGSSLEPTGDNTGLSDTASGDSTLGELPSQSGSAATRIPRARLVSSHADNPWWLWLVVPFVLGGCVALTIAFDAAPDLATRRPGALTRLTQSRSEP